MRIITKRQLDQWRAQYPDAHAGLSNWYKHTIAATWNNLQEVRTTFRSADGAIVKSGKPVTIFNIGGNKYRLITAIHYDRQIVHAMLLLTHREYDKNKWKDIL